MKKIIILYYWALLISLHTVMANAVGIPAITESLESITSKNRLNQEGSALCNLPRTCIWQICSYFPTWKEINTLGRTCKKLDCLVTTPNKLLHINCSNAQGKTRVNYFLPFVFHLLARVGERNGNNPINLDLSFNKLASDENTTEHYFKSSIFEKVSTSIRQINLSRNHLTKIPLQGFLCPNLLEFNIAWNELKNPQDLENLQQCQNLVSLNLNENQLPALPHAITCLTSLQELRLYQNKLTKKDLQLLDNLIQLKKIYVGDNKFTFSDLIHRAAKHWSHKLPNLEYIEAKPIRQGHLSYNELHTLLDSLPEKMGIRWHYSYNDGYILINGLLLSWIEDYTQET